MLFPYFVGIFIGTQMGKSFERTNNKYYSHIEKISSLENKIKEYEMKLGNGHYQ